MYTHFYVNTDITNKSCISQMKRQNKWKISRDRRGKNYFKSQLSECLILTSLKKKTRLDVLKHTKINLEYL